MSSTTSSIPGRGDGGPSQVLDAVVLASIVALSTVRYVGGLGFYSDDWAFLRLMAAAPDQSFTGVASALYDGDVVIRQRPVQVALLAALYTLFGFDPLGYHIVNALVVVLTAVAFHLVLRELGVARLLAFAVPLVFASLPHYSTDRYWVAAFQVPLSMAFYFASVYAALRSGRTVGRSRAGWLTLSAATAAASLLAYEVTLPLLLLTPGLVWARRVGDERPLGERWSRSAVPWALTATSFGVLAVALLFKVSASVRVGAGLEDGLLSHALWLAKGAIGLNFGTYGIGLPYVATWIGVFNRDWPSLLIAATTTAGAYGYTARLAVRHVARSSQSDDVRNARALAGIGAVVFMLGYGVFLTNGDVWFTSTSLGNRVNIAAAVGVSLLAIGGILVLGGVLPDGRWRARAMAGSSAALCGIGVLTTNTLGQFWVEAARRQEDVVEQVVGDLADVELRPGSVVLLDGLCVERGGAYIFTGQRDFGSRLVIEFDDDGLWGTALTEPPILRDDDMVVETYETDVYAYSDRLLVHDLRTRTTTPLPSRAAATQYLKEHPFDRARACPPGFAWGWGRRSLEGG